MTDLARGSRAQRREALPRRTAMGANAPRPSDFGTQSSAPAQGFFSGFMTEETEVENYPVVMIQMMGTDSAGFERATVFEFELPFNFSFDGNLGSNFSALALSKCDYVGFFFADRTGKADFDRKILDLKTKLTASSK